VDEVGGAPILNIFGGKITTYRRLAQSALSKIRPYFDAVGDDWTAGVPLPGGDFPVDGVAELISQLKAGYPFLDDRWAKRLVRAYGTDAKVLLGDARAAGDLGQDFGATLTEREVRWLMNHEYARRAEDIVWRRNKLGLRLSTEQIAALNDWMIANR
jgi:glycerol-3-phosphate dehydrogenase